jgi:hypothetical protein
MSPYSILAEAAKEDSSKSFLSAWNDFACWERARDFADDPNRPSKLDIEWICQLNDLAMLLNDMPGDVQNVRNSLEAAASAFARLDHEPQLCEAIKRWREFRKEEETQEKPTIGADLFPPAGP